jgi:hypothetical protein
VRSKSIQRMSLKFSTYFGYFVYQSNDDNINFLIILFSFLI